MATDQAATNYFDKFDEAIATGVEAGVANYFDKFDAVDEDKGAPSSVRMAVASAKTPEDKLSALQSFYPDAKPTDGDNYVFTDPETKRSTRFNPSGLDVGDIAEWGRGAAEFVGGGIGGTAALIGGQLGPQIALPEELITVPLGAGLGAAMAGDAYDMAVRGVFGIEDTRSTTEILGQDAAAVMANAIGQQAGFIAEKMVKAGVSAGGRLVGQASDKIKEAFTRMDVDPTAGAISGSRFIQGVEQALSKLPSSADIISKKYGATIDGMDRFAKRVAEELSTKEGAEQVGRSISKGVDSFVTKFQGNATELYNKLWAKLPSDTRVPVTNFSNELRDSVGRFSDDPAFKGILDSPTVKRLAEATAESTEGITVGTLKSLRTKIGRELENKSLLSDTTNAELKRLYGSLSEDIKVAAGNAGALRDFERANGFWRAGRQRIDDVLNPMAASGNAEKIYAKVFGKEAGPLKRADAADIRGLMRSLPEGARGDVSAEFVRRMGASTPGTAGFEGAASFSPARFLTQYNKMSDGAKKAVFDSTPGLRKSMDDLALTSAAVKDTFAMANNSGTAGQLMFMSMITGGVGGMYGGAEGAVAGVGAVMSPYAAAKLMTNPKFINWLADAGQTVIADANSIGPVIGRLIAIAEAEPAIKEEIYQYVNALRPATKQE